MKPIELKTAAGRIYLHINYDAANQWLYLHWKGTQTYEGIRAGAEACLQVLAETKCHYLINDNRQVYEPWQEATDWVVNQWAPRAVALGLTHFAQIVSPDSLLTLTPEVMQQALGEQLQMRTFISVSQAQEWLHQARAAVS
ncbi:STAS/SEC14 domain-containing protein [Hymenobacter sp. BT730]|uniref:STAS/SEC14 domain-containing protein n=1 Tax=Hymenobacter sp. BT730 TaxID=3063332 RepID=UPI0026E0CB87|nr:STAS/SEC14 domain-containing protein [Hymenobacter sp. BT730]